MSWMFSKAMMKRYGNLPCSPEPEAEFSEGSCSDGKPYAQLNVMPTPHKFSRNGKTMEFSNLSRFGLTLNLLTESHGEAVLMSFLADFPARTYLVQGKEPELTAKDQACGQNLPVSLARYDPATHSLKTAQCSLIEDLTECYLTLPRWGTMRNGVCWEQVTWARLIREKGCGFSVPTPTCNMVSGGPNHNSPQVVAGKHGINLAGAARLLPTPQASGNRDRGGPSMPCVQRRAEIGKQVSLSQTVDGPLNPPWVEWLMGWQMEWTDLQPSETDRFQQWQQQHSAFSEIG